MRPNREFRHKKPSVEMSDRILSSLTYLTSGLTGFVWLIIVHVQGKSLSPFARYHIFQSIFLSILIYVASLILNILSSIVQIIPFLGALVMNIVYYLVQYPLPLMGGQSLIGLLLLLLTLYLAVFAFKGLYGKIPWVSNIVRQMV